MTQPVAIISGAGTGIGRTIALELHGRGYALSLIGRTSQTLNETAKLCPGAVCAQVDVADHDAVHKFVSRHPRIDVVVNNAGFAPARTMDEITIAEWRQIIDTNLSGAFYLSRAAWPIFKKQNSGVIVNLSSAAARDPFPGLGAYGAAKAGLNLLGLAMAREGKAFGIRVHTIAPAATETAMFRTLMSKDEFPPEKTLDPADIARIVGQCIAGDLRYTSGEVIYIHK